MNHSLILNGFSPSYLISFLLFCPALETDETETVQVVKPSTFNLPSYFLQAQLPLWLNSMLSSESEYTTGTTKIIILWFCLYFDTPSSGHVSWWQKRLTLPKQRLCRSMNWWLKLWKWPNGREFQQLDRFLVITLLRGRLPATFYLLVCFILISFQAR